MLGALVWDVDGTLAETERDGHRVAFNLAFERLGLPWCWSVEGYGELLQVAGGRERLRHDLSRRSLPGMGSAAIERLAAELHGLKNRFYAELVAGGAIALRGGVRELLDECAAAGLPMAIATTTSEANVAALLQPRLGPAWRRRFAAVVGAESSPRKKPDPLAYRMACTALGLPGAACLAIEDSRNGVDAARSAGLPVLVTRSAYFAHEDVGDAMAVCDALAPVTGLALHHALGTAPAAPRIGLALIEQWHSAFTATVPSENAPDRSAAA